MNVIAETYYKLSFCGTKKKENKSHFKKTSVLSYGRVFSDPSKLINQVNRWRKYDNLKDNLLSCYYLSHQAN